MNIVSHFRYLSIAALLILRAVFAQEIMANDIYPDFNYCNATDIKIPDDITFFSNKAKKSTNQKNQSYYKAILASIYRRGVLVHRDNKKALTLVQEAVKNDTTGIAFYEIAIVHKHGIGVKADKKKSVDYYKKAALLLTKYVKENDDPHALYRLGIMYENGIGGLAKDIKESSRLYKLSAEKKHKLGQMLYGSYFKNNKNKLISAETWYCKSAQNGFPYSMKLLADLYLEESDKLTGQLMLSEINQKKFDELIIAARTWYEKAALHDPNPAEWVVFGQMFENGRVFERDYKRAADLYEKAAKAGDREGKYRFAMLLWFENIKPAIRKKDALRYFKEASESGHAGAKNMMEFLSQKKI